MGDTNGTGPVRGRNMHHGNGHVHSGHLNTKSGVPSPDSEETQKQTKKILEEFLKKRIEIGSNKGRIPRESRDTEQKNGSSVNRVQIDGPKRPKLQPLKQASNEQMLYQVMTGQHRSPTRQISAGSFVSTDSADSGEGFQRTKSFVKAQRHSVVTQLESQADQGKVSVRRSSEHIERSPLYPEDTEPYPSDKTDKSTSSPIAHSRASSDPVEVQYSTAERRKHKKEGKEKKSWIPKLPFKKKKDGHKTKGENKELVTPGESEFSGHGIKSSKSASDRHPVIREESVSSKRRTPSPPGSPKRTPKLFGKYHELESGNVKQNSFSSSSSKSPARRDSFDPLEEEPANGETKSRSLPKEVQFSTHPKNSSHKKHHSGDAKHHYSRVESDGVSEHSGKKNQTQRPNTLDIPKKKQRTFTQKLKDLFVDSSPSPSTSSSSEPDIPSSIRGRAESQTTRRSTRRESSDSDKTGSTVTHSHSDKRPSVNNVKDRYHHAPSKSMSDMDSQNSKVNEIVLKLISIADALKPTSDYSGPTGRTQTPDSYQHDQRMSGHNKHTSAVNRSLSSSANKAQSHSMKAFYNLGVAKSKGMESSSWNKGHAQRITRQDVRHRSSSSLDLGVPTQHTKRRERVEAEGPPSSRVRVAHEHHQKKEPQTEALRRNVRSIPKSGHSPRKSKGHSTVESDSASSMPPLLRSTSPHLRSSRTRSPHSGPPMFFGDEPRDHHHLVTSHVTIRTEEHIDRITTQSSPAGERRTVHTHTDRISIVEADSPPFSMDRNESESGLAVAFADGSDDDLDDVEETSGADVDKGPGIPFAHAPLRPRGRAATEPAIPPYSGGEVDEDEIDGDDDDEIDGDSSDDDESAIGAVGGEMNQEKLIEKLVDALRKKGDQLEETPHFEEVTKAMGKLSKEEVKNVLQIAVNTAYSSVAQCRHPEVAQLAAIFNMASIFRQLTSTGIFTSWINQLVEGLGGWTSLERSIDETDQEMKKK